MSKKRANLILLFVAIWLCFLKIHLQAQLLFDKAEYQSRRAAVMEKIPDGIAVVWGALNPVSYHPFVQNNDFNYLTGVRLPNAVLIIDGLRKESILFFTITEKAARDDGIPLELVRNTKEVTGIERVQPLADFGNILASYIARNRVVYTPFSPEELSQECSLEKLRTFKRIITMNIWDGRLTREEQFVSRLREMFPAVQVKDCSGFIWELRTIKSPAEIEVLRKAGRIGVKAYIEMLKAVKPGMYEYELAAYFDYLCKKEGVRDQAYGIIISSGENHPYVHYYRHDRLLKNGDFVVMDAGPELDSYDVDITISFPVSGKFTPRQKEVYEACLAVHEACLEVYRPGLTAERVREEVNEILKRRGYDLNKDYFQKMRGSFGHYVGMAVHDVGGGPSVLKPGMVFANEPLIIYESENLGVRVENTILITETGCENLTAGIPRKVEEMEYLMKNKKLMKK